MRQKTGKKLIIFLLIMTGLILSGGCALKISPKGAATRPPEQVFPQKVQAPELVPVEFNAELRQSYSPETTLALNVLDEVSGLDYNISQYELTRVSENRYSGTLFLPLGAIIKYRYQSTFPIDQPEAAADGSSVAYRVAVISRNLQINDSISGWPELPYAGTTGKLSGIVSDQQTQKPLADCLVALSGYLTFTDMTGRFFFEHIPEGVHSLTVVSIDGKYQAFQQRANVLSGLSTPAVIALNPLPEVTVKFIVSLPDEALGAPVRIAGNLSQLGNVYADIAAGESTLAARMPLLTRMDDGRYTISLKLNAGTDLVYKYTLGDGLVNAERDKQQKLVLRRFIVPDKDVTVVDKVITWKPESANPVSIQVSVPENTPSGDSISIQFARDDVWRQPVPMWPVSKNAWMFLLFETAKNADGMQYRICRNDQCELAYDEASFSSPVPVGQAPENLYSVTSWHLWKNAAAPSLPSAAQPENGQLLGVEFTAAYQPSDLNRYRDVFKELKALGVNWVIFSPSWQVTDLDGLPYLDPNPAGGMMIMDLLQIIQLAQEQGLTVALYPKLNFSPDTSGWWKSTQRNALWWQQWYQEYDHFVMNYAQLAAYSKVDQFILGGADVGPSLPGALLTTATNSGTPKTAEKIWTELIRKVNTYYQGEVLWALPVQDQAFSTYSFFSEIDGIYAQIQFPAENYAYYDRDTASGFVQTNLAAYRDEVDLPIYIGLNAPSASSESFSCKAADCLRSPRAGSCPEQQVDLERQNYFYYSYWPVLRSSSWITGTATRGFYSVVMLQDCSSSVYGKPAFETILR